MLVEASGALATVLGEGVVSPKSGVGAVVVVAEVALGVVDAVRDARGDTGGKLGELRTCSSSRRRTSSVDGSCVGGFVVMGNFAKEKNLVKRKRVRSSMDMCQGCHATLHTIPHTIPCHPCTPTNLPHDIGIRPDLWLPHVTCPQRCKILGD